MREKLQPHEHILGITEELAGLLMKEVIDDNGLFSPNRRNKWSPCISSNRRRALVPVVVSSMYMCKGNLRSFAPNICLLDLYIMNERVQLVVAYKYLLCNFYFKMKKWNKRGGGGGGGGLLHTSNPKAAVFCARHVEALLSRVVIPPATKGCAPGAPRACHVVDHMSRVVSDSRQKGGPFVAPSLSRLAARDKRPLRPTTKGLFSTSGFRALVSWIESILRSIYSIVISRRVVVTFRSFFTQSLGKC